VLKTDTAVPPSDPSVLTEADCGANEPGELWLRSPNIAIGYWNNPKANRETFVDGWLRTGDRFRVDEGGNFWFADRAKVGDLYIYKVVGYLTISVGYS